MKRHLLLIPMILATTAAIADAQTTAPSAPADAQAQAAALLSGSRLSSSQTNRTHSGVSTVGSAR